MATLLIDDQRNLEADRVARTYNDGIAALSERKWDVLLLDHDLGDFSGPDGRERNGYHIVCWLEEHPEQMPDKVIVVSSNPAGRLNIARVLAKFFPEWQHRR
jgi:hypothetical protein